jgi:hypothetical protein
VLWGASGGRSAPQPVAATDLGGGAVEVDFGGGEGGQEGVVSPFTVVSTEGMTYYTYIFRCSSCGKHAELRRMPDPGVSSECLIAAYELVGIVVRTHGSPRCAACLAIPILVAAPEGYRPADRTVRPKTAPVHPENRPENSPEK